MNRHIKQHIENEVPVSIFSLRIGEWKKFFAKDEYKLMIAKSLNYCVFNEEPRKHDDFVVEIVGYHISAYELCLVIRMDPANINKMLMFFYQMIRDEIRLGLDKQGLKKKSIESSLTETLYLNLFEKCPANYLLVKLITGQEVKLGYFNPRLALMKERIHDYNFSSAIDYAAKSAIDYAAKKDDSVGPVQVTKITMPLKIKNNNTR